MQGTAHGMKSEEKKFGLILIIANTKRKTILPKNVADSGMLTM